MMTKIILALASGLLLILGVPRFLAAIWMAVGVPFYDDIVNRRPVEPADIDLLMESREAAFSLSGEPKALAELGTIYSTTSQTPESIALAIETTKQALALNPVDSFTWHRLAVLLAGTPDGAEEALTAWRTSHGLAPYEPPLYNQQFHIGVFLYRNMTEEDRGILREYANRAYARSRGGFRKYARDNDLLEWAKFVLRDPKKTAYLSS